MDLKEIRNEIDAIDGELVKLFEKRMETVRRVAEYKMENNLPIFNSGRERDIVNSVTSKVNPELATYTKILYGTLFDVSRSYQAKAIFQTSPVVEKIKKALEETPKMFPQTATVACQGTEGAYSQQACEKLFYNPSIIYFEGFRGVFEAVEKGLCDYGILPVENSVHGTVTQVVDLMGRYDVSIVKSAKIHVSHALLAKNKDAKITEVLSHPQALGQCDEFLEKAGIKATVCENTAVAAKLIAESDRDDIGAISSPGCAGLYGLQVINDKVSNSDNNHTRFICISKKTEIYPGADRISFSISLSHQPGALYSLISKFAAVGINLTKIESRPIPGRDFEFMFYFDMAVSVYSEELMSIISEISLENPSFKLLGAYSEM